MRTSYLFILVDSDYLSHAFLLTFCFNSVKTRIHSLLNHDPLQHLTDLILGKSEESYQVIFFIIHAHFIAFHLACSSTFLPSLLVAARMTFPHFSDFAFFPDIYFGGLH